MTKAEGFLDKAYGLGDAEETRALYRDWAKSYDAELRAAGYASPARVAAAMAASVADRAAPLLDLGCGTGLSGEALRAEGFAAVDGTDFSAEMLAAAAAKGVYRRLIPGDLNRPIPAAPGDYANMVAVGVFSPGHAPPETIEAAVELLPAGGCFGFTLNDHALDEGVYEARVFALRDRGMAEIAFEDYGAHLPRRGLQAKVYVLRRT